MTTMPLLKKSIQVLQEEGIAVFFIKLKNYLYKKIHEYRTVDEYKAAKEVYADVLFVNGCCLPHPYRYRVLHQQEQLFAYGLEVRELYYTKVTPELVDHFRTFVLYRCPLTPAVKELIERAKYYNKSVLFDIDDLVIDTKYTDEIPHVRSLLPEEKRTYDDGVNSYRETMLLCDAVMTTTERLAEELRHYKENVFINRNTVSEEMVRLSQNAPRKKAAGMRLGYFSGSITHNSDFAMILPVLCQLMDKYSELYLHIVGELELPLELEKYKQRIMALPFVDWKKLPEMIAQVDINLAPLTDTIFNEAKSENKWLEAALVKVPTVASDGGAFRVMIQDQKTGCLCKNLAEWYSTLDALLSNPCLRHEIAANAYHFVLEHCVTTNTGKNLAAYIRKQQRPNIAFAVPSLNLSGGIMVAFRHGEILRQAGYDVTFINGAAKSEKGDRQAFYKGGRLSTIPLTQPIIGKIDKYVATMWSTNEFLEKTGNLREKYYLVQNFETDFYEHGAKQRSLANRTYCQAEGMTYITISRWCQHWLRDKFGQQARYAPNGLERAMFFQKPRSFMGKIKILIEGDSESCYKNVDEAFNIVDKLAAEKYEIWFMSYHGKAKKWYKVDKFLHKIPYEKVGDVYRACDILLKTSVLESFSYPPLEMMATGGYVVVCPNGGNVEYLEDGRNCLFYPQGEWSAAVACIERITAEPLLRQKLYQGGMETAAGRDWQRLEKDILALYGCQ